MRIACPRCEETYRIDPTRLPGRRVRTACLACGEPLFLRPVDGASRRVPGVEAVTTVDDVPIWGEPRTEVESPAAAAPAESGPEDRPLEPFLGGAAPGARETRPLDPFIAPLEEEPPERPFSPAQERPLEPFVRPAEERPLEPFVRPAEERPLEPFVTPSPEPPREAAEPSTLEAPAADLGLAPAAPLRPRPPEPVERPPAEPVRPLDPFVGTREPKPLEPFLPPAPGEPARRGGFTFAQVGDVSTRAQRLARALVSDILVYHPKKVEQGLREGNLRETMKEEVEKSWDEYCDRLGSDAARTNRAAFVAALNEILARGKPVF